MAGRTRGLCVCVGGGGDRSWQGGRGNKERFNYRKHEVAIQSCQLCIYNYVTIKQTIDF